MNEIEIYKSPDNQIQLQVNLDNDTVWLTQVQMAELFGKAEPPLLNISKMFLRKLSWMKIWHVGISDIPLNIALYKARRRKQ